MVEFTFLGIPKIVWIILLVVGFFYGQIKTAMALSAAWTRFQRNKKLPLWPATLRNTRTLNLKVEGDNAIILEKTALGGYVIKHVFANVSVVTVTYKSDVLSGSQAQAEAVFARWVAEGLSAEGRVDGFRQLMPTYTPPKPKKGWFK